MRGMAARVSRCRGFTHEPGIPEPFIGVAGRAPDVHRVGPRIREVAQKLDWKIHIRVLNFAQSLGQSSEFSNFTLWLQQRSRECRASVSQLPFQGGHRALVRERRCALAAALRPVARQRACGDHRVENMKRVKIMSACSSIARNMVSIYGFLAIEVMHEVGGVG
jgi:hypothetical protein